MQEGAAQQQRTFQQKEEAFHETIAQLQKQLLDDRQAHAQELEIARAEAAVQVQHLQNQVLQMEQQVQAETLQLRNAILGDVETIKERSVTLERVSKHSSYLVCRQAGL